MQLELLLLLLLCVMLLLLLLVVVVADRGLADRGLGISRRHLRLKYLLL
jgi:hypothetical protein